MASTPLLDTAVPKLAALETLSGRARATAESSAASRSRRSQGRKIAELQRAVKNLERRR